MQVVPILRLSIMAELFFQIYNPENSNNYDRIH